MLVFLQRYHTSAETPESAARLGYTPITARSGTLRPLERYLHLCQQNRALADRITAHVGERGGARFMSVIAALDVSPEYALTLLDINDRLALHEAHPTADTFDALRQTLEQAQEIAASQASSGAQVWSGGAEGLFARLGEINPSWRSVTARDTANCYQCVAAVARFVAGEQFQPARSVTAQEQREVNATRWLETTLGSRFDDTELVDAVRLIAQRGHGAQGVIKLRLPDGGLHFFNVVNVQGNVYLIDGQSNRHQQVYRASTAPGLLVPSMNDPSLLREFLTDQISERVEDGFRWARDVRSLEAQGDTAAANALVNAETLVWFMLLPGSEPAASENPRVEQIHDRVEPLVMQFLQDIIDNPPHPSSASAARQMQAYVRVLPPDRIHVALKDGRVIGVMASATITQPEPARYVSLLIGSGAGGGTALLQEAFRLSPGRLVLEATEDAEAFYLKLSPSAIEGDKIIWTRMPQRAER